MQTTIYKKILLFVIMSGAISLTLACVGFGIVEFYKIKNEAIARLNSQMDILVYNLQPTLIFEDKEAADKILRSLHNDPSINRVRIYKADRREFTSFIRNDQDGNIKLSKNVFYDQKRIGRLEIESVYLGIKEKYMTYFLISLLIIIISIPASYVISGPLRSQVSKGVVQLVETTEALRRSNQDLEQFAYVASHDLQEPIRKIVGFSQLFAKAFEGKMDKDSEEYMKYIVDGAKRMQILIQDLLQFSRISSEKLALEMVDLNDVVKEAIQTHEPMIKETQAKIHTNKLPTLEAHKVQMAQLFQNLIGNALKYRGDANPEVFIGVEKKRSGWEFSVKDNGIGIAPEFFERIFIIFQRLHSRTSKYPGTGIGLAICKRVVELHGGRIWVEAAPGHGTVFKFAIPDKKDVTE